MTAKWLLLIPAMAGLAWAQGQRPSFNKSFPWWEGPVANDLNLTDTQTRQIRATVAQYRSRLSELRAAVDRAERELEDVFNDETVDQSRANEAIDQLVAARGDLFRTTSQMDLKLRSVLTAEQWQDLQARQRGGRPGPGPRPVGGRRRGPGPGLKGGPPPAISTSKVAQPTTQQSSAQQSGAQK